MIHMYYLLRIWQKLRPDYMEGGLPLFTELPRRLIPGNWASGIPSSRQLRA